MTAREDAIGRLRQHCSTLDSTSIRELFKQDDQRFSKFSAQLGPLLLDASKCRITVETLSLLDTLQHAAGVGAKRDAMFAGQPVNTTEGRPALHIALRSQSGRPITVNGKDVMPEIRETLARLEAFAHSVRSGTLTGSGGKRFTDVVNIGIGGSDLGPAMATLALRPYHDGPRLHFVSNVDGAHISDTLAELAPETTLFLIASKTFTTLETMTNAQTARSWLSAKLGESAVGLHFAALSTALDKVSAFGIPADRTFGFWDWVGGRYSIWSAIGLPLMIAIGPDNFRAFFAGAHQVDENFRTADFRENLPLLLGTIGYWHRAICGYPARAVLPYDQRLARFPAHLQQLDMESNGKSVAADGAPLDGPSGPIVFGEPGTNGQHAFFQLLHQGSDIIPCEFLIAAKGHEPELAHHHRLLVANCLAQSEAMAFGKSRSEVDAELRANGLSNDDIARIAPHKVFAGNRPSVTLAYRCLDPATLGMLIALFEHRVFVEAALYGNNPFDQWGVELGKTLARRIDTALLDPSKSQPMTASTRGLIAYLLKQ